MVDGHDLSIIYLVCSCCEREAYDKECYLEIDVSKGQCYLNLLKPSSNLTYHQV
jgi:hypothetical protein